jgi:hypothetical protein
MGGRRQDKGKVRGRDIRTDGRAEKDIVAEKLMGYYKKRWR